MAAVNLYAAWIGIFLGLVAGAVQGLFFHHDEWLQGYASWSRRMLRLGHISFFGIAFLNLAFAVTVISTSVFPAAAENPARWSSGLFIAGAITMPTVCYLSAVHKPFRHLFFIPVTSLVVAVGIVIVGVLIR